MRNVILALLMLIVGVTALGLHNDYSVKSATV